MSPVETDLDQTGKVVVIEDDDALATIILETLKRYGFAAERCEDYEDITACLTPGLTDDLPGVVLLDINLPKFDGFELCRRIRRVSTVPVLFLSARDGSMDIVMAHSVGGDDYLTKPFDMEVLIAKIRAQLRRAFGYAGAPRQPLEYAGVVVDPSAATVSFLGRSEPLTRNELKLLATLLENAGVVVARADLEEALWSLDSYPDENTLTVNVNRVRKLLTRIGAPELITTVRGIGYRFG